jgi:hypothetical protein
VLEHYLSTEALAFSAIRLGLAGAVLLAFALLARRPRPRLALAVLLGLHVAEWIAYRLSLRRPYGLGEGSDRTFNLGMAAAVATGHSPFEHTQVGHGSPEPFWNLVVAGMAGMEPSRVAAAWDALTPLAILAVGIATFMWIRGRHAGLDESWAALTVAFSVLGLSSLSMSPRPPVPPFWVANFMYKPNHGFGYALIAAAAGLSARGRTWPLAIVLSLLAWVFLPGWAYAVAALVAAMALQPAADRRWRPLVVAIAIAAVAAAPYVLHLWRDYAPTQGTATARHMWADPNALVLAVPTWSTIDLGPLLTLGLAGLWLARRRTQPWDAALMGLALTGWGLWLLSVPLALLGLAPEPDELHYFVRFVLSVSAGVALAAVARTWSRIHGIEPGRAHLLILAACLPLTFPLYHDPPTMDRYYPESTRPIPPKVVAAAGWIRDNTPKDAVFAAGRSAAMWIPALTGRRVLLAEAGKLVPADLDARKEIERTLLTSNDATAVRAAARRYGVTHVAIDEDLVHRYRGDSFAALATGPWNRTVFANTAVRIVELYR